MNENASLKVRKGSQVFGPMSVIQLAELLASGRIAETDDVSEDGRSWLQITTYFEQQLAPPPAPPPPLPAASPTPKANAPEKDDFSPYFPDNDPWTAAPLVLSEIPSGQQESTKQESSDSELSPRAKQERSQKPPRKKHDEDDDDFDAPTDAHSASIDHALHSLEEYERMAPAIGATGSRGPRERNVDAVPPPRLTAEERREGFVLLFNGKKFSGWRFREGSALSDKLPHNWTIARGGIQVTGGAQPPLMSQWDYFDFDFRFEWRGLSEKYHSVLCLRSNRKVGNNQLSLKFGNEGVFTDGDLDGDHSVEDLQHPPGKWNSWRVLAEGDRVTLWCNGAMAWEAVGLQPAGGYLGFLPVGTPMEFANLRIRELGLKYLNELEAHWSPFGGKRQCWKQLGDSLVGEKDAIGCIETVQRDFKNYVIRLDWKPTRSSVGTLYLRGAACRESGVQLGGAENGSGGLPGIRVAPDRKLDNPDDQWNFLEARVINNVVTVRLNGEDVVQRAKLSGGGIPESGPIGLGHNGRAIQFRNIRIRAFDDSSAQNSRR